MSTPGAKPTRQQLEELDALLQRMLSLPINQLEAELPVQQPVPVMPPPMPMAAAPPPPAWHASPLPMPAPMPPPRRAEPPRGDNAWQIPLPPNAGGASFGSYPAGIEALTSSATSNITRPVAPPPVGRLNVTMVPSPDEHNRAREAPPQGPRPLAEPPAAAQAMPPTVVLSGLVPFSLPSGAAEPPLPFYLWPLGLVDRSLGSALAAFGLPGRWIGEGSGKVLVGWAGLFMLAGAAVWGVMDYLGWSW